MSTVEATYDVETDAQFLHNQLKVYESGQQAIFVQNQLEYLQSGDAAVKQSPADLVYMRKVWFTVAKLIDEANRPKIDVPVRNVRYSKKFE